MIINLNTATGTQYLWKQERIILRGTGQGYAPLYIWTNLHGSQAQPLAAYEQVGGVTNADITDYVRAHPTLSKIYYADDLSPDTTPQELSVSVAGLINPLNDIIPFNCESVAVLSAQSQTPPYLDGLILTPPRMILRPFTGIAVYAETRVKTGYEQRYSTYPTALFDVQRNTIEIPSTTGSFAIWDDAEQEKAFEYEITPRMDERTYTMLQWTSRYGTIKLFVFEIRDVKYTTQGEVEIENQNNEFEIRKGSLLSFTARLEGLTAYDYWYYSDIINSSNVQAYLNGSWRKVQVATKDVTIPNGSAGEFKTLEIKINFAKYDAI